MEIESITGNTEQKNANRNTSGHRTQSENRTQKKSRCFMRIIVCLGLICALLVVGLVGLHMYFAVKRVLMKMSYMNIVEEYNETLSTLQMNYKHLAYEKEKLQKNIDVMGKKKLKLDTRFKHLSDELMNNAESDFLKLIGPCKYYIISEKKSWSNSRQFCRDHGGDLIIINTEEEQKFITSSIKDRVWIGLSDLESEGIMKWVDNTPLNKGFWYQDEPNDKNGNEDCVELLGAELYNWNDLPCSEYRKWICEF